MENEICHGVDLLFAAIVVKVSSFQITMCIVRLSGYHGVNFKLVLVELFLLSNSRVETNVPNRHVGFMSADQSGTYLKDVNH